MSSPAIEKSGRSGRTRDDRRGNPCERARLERLFAREIRRYRRSAPLAWRGGCAFAASGDVSPDDAARMGRTGDVSGEQVEVIEELAKANTSAACCVMIGCDSGFFAGFLEDGAAREIYPRLDNVHCRQRNTLRARRARCGRISSHRTMVVRFRRDACRCVGKWRSPQRRSRTR